MSLITRIIKIITGWYRGKYIPPNTKHNGLFTIHGYYEQHLLSKILGAIWHFYILHWQWIWSTIIALLGLYLAVLTLK